VDPIFLTVTNGPARRDLDDNVTARANFFDHILKDIFPTGGPAIFISDVEMDHGRTGLPGLHGGLGDFIGRKREMGGILPCEFGPHQGGR
jgi:hypothetical protein